MRNVILLMGGTMLAVSACASFRQSFHTVPAATVEPDPKVQLHGFAFNPETNTLSILDSADEDLRVCIPSTAYHSLDGQSCMVLRDVRFYLEGLKRADE